MKKGVLIFWMVVIIGSVYVVSSATKNFDAKKVNNPFSEIINSTSTAFYFNGISYDSRFLPLDFRSIKLSGYSFFVKVVSNEDERSKGLSGVDRMDDNVGMLFVFDTSGTYGFWMKDMNFPIDIIWLDDNLNVIEVTKNFSPESYPKSVFPPTPVRFVLEINAGIAEKIGIKKGDTVSF
jgi:uncharacterized membrane protein (UPF0127 family)